MMATTDERILRRMSLLYMEGDKVINLLTIVEQIEPDMPDYVFSPKELVACNEGALRIDIEDYNVTYDWQNDVKSVCERIPVCGNKEYKREPRNSYHVLSQEFDETNLTKILPFRKGPYYLVRYQNSKICVEELLENENLRRQITEITEKQLGYDLCNYKQWIGDIFMVWHHSIIKDIHLTGTDNPAGMLCTVIRRKPDEMKLVFRITDRDKNGNQIGEVTEQIANIEDGKFLLMTPQPVTRPDVEIRDDKGEVVYSVKNIIFIKKIILNMGVIDGVTGKKENVMERDIIASGSSKEVNSVGKKREEITLKITSMLEELPLEEAELVFEEVKKRIKA